MEGVLAISGFWTFCILFLLRVTKSRKSRGEQHQEIEALKTRLVALEQEMSIANHQMLQFKDEHDFAMKLLTDKSKVKAGV